MSEALKQMLRRLYNAVPLKPFVFRAVRRLANIPPSLSHHLYFEGVFTTSIADQTVRLYNPGKALETALFWNGITAIDEPQSMALWMKLAQHARVILDVGANTGIYAITAKIVQPTARVLGFEPIERIYQRFVTNCQMNQLDIACRSYAVSDEDGQGTIYDLPETHHYRASLRPEVVQHLTPTLISKSIQLHRLTTIMAEERLESIDLIKIDVEGAEPFVIAGGGDLWKRHRPGILIEINRDDTGSTIEALLKDLGYLFFNIDEKNPPRRVDHLVRSQERNYLLCSHEQAAYLNLL